MTIQLGERICFVVFFCRMSNRICTGHVTKKRVTKNRAMSQGRVRGNDQIKQENTQLTLYRPRKPSFLMVWRKQSKGPLKIGTSNGWVCRRTLTVSKGNSTNLPATPAIYEIRLQKSPPQKANAEEERLELVSRQLVLRVLPLENQDSTGKRCCLQNQRQGP